MAEVAPTVEQPHRNAWAAPLRALGADRGKAPRAAIQRSTSGLSNDLNGGQGRNRTTDTRIFSPRPKTSYVAEITAKTYVTIQYFYEIRALKVLIHRDSAT
jgi:hypothetical protein